jgi:hypothetical protein
MTGNVEATPLEWGQAAQHLCVLTPSAIEPLQPYLSTAKSAASGASQTRKRHSITQYSLQTISSIFPKTLTKS